MSVEFKRAAGARPIAWLEPPRLVFHILDRDWGPVTIKIRGHPPFPAQIIFNGHEIVAIQARQIGLRFRKDGNCFTQTWFTQIWDPIGLARIADPLSDSRTIRRLRGTCERWIYSACLCFTSA